MSTLVLNRNWIPIHITTWDRALSLLYKEHAHCLAREAVDGSFQTYNYDAWVALSHTLTDHPKVKTIRYEIAIPDIIILTLYDHLPQRDVKFSRENVFQRDKHLCAYCGHKFPKELLTIDHVIPREHGGKSVWKNVVSSCKPCNAKKRNRTPEQAGMYLLKKPVEPKWFTPLGKLITRADLKPGWENFLELIEST